MKRLLSVFALAAFAILLMAPVVLAGEPALNVGDRTMDDLGGRMADNGDIVYRCATEGKSKTHIDVPGQDEIERFIIENRIAAGGVIPVNFHVIYSGTQGNVSNATIAAQITVLNRNFAGKDYNGNVVPGARNTGYTFVLNSTTRTNSASWFVMTPGSTAERNAKNALCVNQTSTLNLYSAKPGQGLLGWATFPQDISRNGKMDGVVIHYASMPGGSLAPYNLGGTGTHEVGHWVGLYHTFQGGCGTSSCSTTGDLVCDTPAEASPTSGCPSSKNTCSSAGNDPIHNYMDYSTDICYTNFTTGQDARADFLMSTYRPAIGSARVAESGTDLPESDFRTSEGHGPRNADTGDVVYRCATDEEHGKLDAPTRAQIDEWIAQGRVAAGGVIPVNVHVIQGRGGVGNVTDAQIAAQILVLNRNYAGQDYNGNPVPGAKNTGYTFTLASTNRTVNRKWFGMTPGSQAEAQAKSSLVVNPTTSLNLYTCSPGQNLLGWATFPWNLAGNPTMDGVVIHYASFPGGSLAPYNLGGTATHEVGHWVGLYHTFQGGCGTSDCANSGDLVCDTPAEGTATSGCPGNKDTCAGAGLDPVHNYMDYSTDICYNNFTPGQDSRADAMMANYRPSIGSARLADSDLPISDFRTNEGHGPRNADNGDVVYRCATDEKGANMKAPKKEEIDLWIETNKVAAGGVIPVNVHIIMGRGNAGNVTDAQVAAQILVLNRNYAGLDYNGNPVPGAKNTGYTFTLASTNRTVNRKWFGMTPGSQAEAQAKSSLVVNPTTSLNLYTCSPGQNLLGWATFPWNLAGNPTMDGVVIHYASFPGGSLAPYNLGGTATHEVGHWVGLYHTFQGGCGTSDCANSGDLVCDTPAEGTATSGCPGNKDTCAGAGLDPVHNYMDYSTDICYNNFTPGQDSRADFMMSNYRSLIGSARPINPAGSIANARDLNGGLVDFKAKPNPFNPRTKIEFGLAREGRATVRIFDVNGRLVSTVVDRYLTAGNHSFDFDGAKLASGVYWMRLQVNGQADEVKRLSLLK